jgi:hypothetical protein
MTDIVERLRESAVNGLVSEADAMEAADEIERLRRDCAVDVSELYREIERLRVMYNDCIKDLREASE